MTSTNTEKRKHEEYYLALARIELGTPKIVRKTVKISNDSVSLEAGRKKGSIKKSRAQFKDLISAIDASAAKQARDSLAQSSRLGHAKELSQDLRLQLEAALGRELSLLAELYETKKKLRMLTGEKVLPIRGNR